MQMGYGAPASSPASRILVRWRPKKPRRQSQTSGSYFFFERTEPETLNLFGSVGQHKAKPVVKEWW